DPELARLRQELRQHPCHGCADREEHARWAERYLRLARETEGLRRRVDGATHSISRTFHRVCALLEHRGYLAADPGPPPGRPLARIWAEADRLVAEWLRAGVWERLSPAELAGCVSALLYESRRDTERMAPVPAGAVRTALAGTAALWVELSAEEREHGLA